MLVLIRGLPGSGKSTLAINEYPGFTHLETDMYFINENDEYVFNSEKLREAHNWCQYACFIGLWSGDDVIVSNTFSQRWEMEPYIKMAKDFGISYYVIEAKGQYANQHNIPELTIQRWEII